MAAGPFCSLHHLLMGGFRPTKPDVVFHRVVKEVHILKDHADVFQHAVRSIIPHIFSANPNGPFLHIPKAGNQIAECSLAAAGGPYNRAGGMLRDFHRNIIDYPSIPIFRIEKTRDYTVMSNHHLRDKSLSLKAKGLLSLMLSLPEEWDYTTKGLARICKDGVDSICAGVRELEEHGYEEWFITDYDCYVDGLYDKLGEYENLDELNYLASKLDEMSQGEYEQFQAAMEIGDHSGSLQEIINLTENLDCYDIYPDIHDHDDLGRYYIEELDAMQVPEHLRNYIDYEAYGRDVALEEGGEFTDLGYVRDTGSSFHEYYDGEHGSIPEEYRVMTFQDAEELTEEEKSEWAMDIAYDMDEFFRQHDPQYAAEHPEEHAAKEEIYENLMAGRISALDEKLAALGQTQEDYLPSEIEKFKDATGYEEFLDFDPAVIKAALEDPDKSHADEMLAFAEQAGREYEAELAGQTPAPSPDDRETGETVRTPRGTFYVTDMSREQMEAAGYGLYHQSDDGKYLVMGNGSRSFAIRNEEVQEHITPEKMTVLVVEPMKKPYVKEIDPGLHSLQAEVGGDIATAYPFSDPVGLVCNDEGKLIGLELNRGLRDEHGEIYDIMAGTFLVVGLSEDSFTSLTPEQVQKYTEHFKQPEQFISLNGQIIALPAEPENPLRTAEMTLEDDYGMIDGVLNNGRKGEEQEKAQGEAHRGAPEKRPSIRERLAEAKRECGERKPPDRAQQKKPPEHDL